MGDVVDFTGDTILPLDPDKVLEGAKTKLKYVAILGVTHDGKTYTASSTSDMKDILWHTVQFQHKLFRGDYD